MARPAAELALMIVVVLAVVLGHLPVPRVTAAATAGDACCGTIDAEAGERDDTPAAEPEAPAPEPCCPEGCQCACCAFFAAAPPTAPPPTPEARAFVHTASHLGDRASAARSILRPPRTA